MKRFSCPFVIALCIFYVIFYSARVEAQLRVIAILDQENPASAGFWLQKGALWWALHSDYLIIDNQLERIPLGEQEYYLLIEQAPDHSEQIYPVEGSRIFRFFSRQTPNRSGGIYIYRIKKCNESTCEFVSGTISGPLVVFDDRNNSPDTEFEFRRLPDLVTQVLDFAEYLETSGDLKTELNSLRSLQLDDPTDFDGMYRIARGIAITQEYQSVILGPR